MVKLRRVYAHAAGVTLSEQLTVDGDEAHAHTMPAGRAGAPLTDVVLVHPRAALREPHFAHSPGNAHASRDTQVEPAHANAHGDRHAVRSSTGACPHLPENPS